MKLFQILIGILVIGNYSCTTRTQDRPPYYITEELHDPIAFADGNITTTNGINFSKDGRSLYLSKNIAKELRNGRPFAGIFISNFEDGDWSSPRFIELGIAIDAYHPVLSMDNQTLFFNSRSHPDTLDLPIPHNIWYCKKTEKGWSVPKMVEGINSTSYDSYPTIARNNNLYFNSDRPGGKGGMDIFFAKYVNGKYQEPVAIEKLNSTDSENDLVIDPDERFIIFNRYSNATNTLDLYIAFKDGLGWGAPTPLEEINTPDKWELTPTLSPDGNYFFYELNGTIMQFELEKLLKSK